MGSQTADVHDDAPIQAILNAGPAHRMVLVVVNLRSSRSVRSRGRSRITTNRSGQQPANR